MAPWCWPTRAEGVDKDQFYKRIPGYSGVVIVAGPVLAWLALVVLGWL
ncbi:hypothetical protein GCM10007170_22190 [Arthrobacter liuii]|uniref:Uncharacterized protein n=1 Tax=Arthrobacter liuii TaxID=1476996 RepID=A0ABQ2ASX5_9MICC|nr:hypothetical protein GCM10007170_22190 [Arthrobacter liuii]